ncbi:glucose-6-phosphate isomerase [Aeoliella sp. SH292]|uniref:glucose-6-phosphate isomerase n=1 Tax=Aeoliella sp. SH292 TaxID=3454464 RepID=UPI003F9A31A9
MLQYNLDGTLIGPGGLEAADLEKLASPLTSIREEVLAEADLWASGGNVPDAKQPLDAGFHLLPNRLLDELAAEGDDSELARIQASADRLSELVDRVVVLGIGGSYMGARALLEACCHPYYNQVAPTLRHGRPEIYFEGNNVDNDAVHGLLDLLAGDSRDWGIVCISKSGGTLETAAAFRIFLRELAESVGDEQLGKYVVPVTGDSGKLFDLATAIGCSERFPVPDGVGGRFSVLSAVGLLPAAIMGLDIEALLAGAAEMNEHFATASFEKNIVLQYVAAGHAMEKKHGADIRILSTWGKRLEAVGLWYDQLLAESLGKHEKGAMPLTIVNTRDLHSRGQQHQEGKRDKYITNLIVAEGTREPIAIGESDNNQDGLNELAKKTLPEVLSAAIAGTNQAYREDNRPTADLVIPELDELHLGQLLQMLMLATVVEGRLISVNPYGQPGVEAYKKNMNAILRK